MSHGACVKITLLDPLEDIQFSIYPMIGGIDLLHGINLMVASDNTWQGMLTCNKISLIVFL